MYSRVSRAIAAGLTFRPLATTVQDLLAWFRSLPAEVPVLHQDLIGRLVAHVGASSVAARRTVCITRTATHWMA